LKSGTVLEDRFRGRDTGLDRVDLDGSIVDIRRTGARALELHPDVEAIRHSQLDG
jgi:hypothetical protein